MGGGEWVSVNPILSHRVLNNQIRANIQDG